MECTTCTMNYKRILLGALLAGVWINLVEFGTHHYLLAFRYSELARMGHVYPNPVLPFLPAYNLLAFLTGGILAWLYAAVRDTIKPGACTAIKVGLAVSFAAALPEKFAEASWAVTGKYVALVSFLAIVVDCLGGAILAGLVYRPRATNG